MVSAHCHMEDMGLGDDPSWGNTSISPKCQRPSCSRTHAPAGSHPPGTPSQAEVKAVVRQGVPSHIEVTARSCLRSIQPWYPSGSRTSTQFPAPLLTSVTVSPASTSFTHSARSDASALNGTWLRGHQASVISKRRSSQRFDNHRGGAASAVANASATHLLALLLERVDQSHHDARAA